MDNIKRLFRGMVATVLFLVAFSLEAMCPALEQGPLAQLGFEYIKDGYHDFHKIGWLNVPGINNKVLALVRVYYGGYKITYITDMDNPKALPAGLLEWWQLRSYTMPLSTIGPNPYQTDYIYSEAEGVYRNETTGELREYDPTIPQQHPSSQVVDSFGGENILFWFKKPINISAQDYDYFVQGLRSLLKPFELEPEELQEQIEYYINWKTQRIVQTDLIDKVKGYVSEILSDEQKGDFIQGLLFLLSPHAERIAFGFKLPVNWDNQMQERIRMWQESRRGTQQLQELKRQEPEKYEELWIEESWDDGLSEEAFSAVLEKVQGLKDYLATIRIEIDRSMIQKALGELNETGATTLQSLGEVWPGKTIKVIRDDIKRQLYKDAGEQRAWDDLAPEGKMFLNPGLLFWD